MNTPEVIVVSPNCTIETEPLRPSPGTKPSKRLLSVAAVNFFGGRYAVNRDLSREHLRRWRGHHGLDSLALRAAGIAAPDVDAIVLGRQPGETPSSQMTSLVMWRMQQDRGGINLPTLVKTAFAEEALHVTHTDPTVPDMTGSEFTLGMRSIDLLAQNQSTDAQLRDRWAEIMEEYRLMRELPDGPLHTSLDYERGKVYQELGVHSAHAAITRLQLASTGLS